jgi:phosphatidate cytidylyltransferase
MHSKRLAVSLLVLPLLYLYIMYLPPVFFFFLLLAVSLMALYEFCSMYRLNRTFSYASFLLGSAIVGVSFFEKQYSPDVFIVAAMAIIVMRLLLKRDPSSALADTASPVIGLMYIPGLLSFQGQIRHIGAEWIIFLYATVWASDSLAYYIGKGFGKRRLYREVSPNKTVAGAGGSVIGGVSGAIILRALVVPQVGMVQAIFIGIIVGIVSIIGDLVESMFKRDAGVKDSGSLIPGHGGILDKIDGSLFAGPILYWILKGMI